MSRLLMLTAARSTSAEEPRCARDQKPGSGCLDTGITEGKLRHTLLAVAHRVEAEDALYSALRERCSRGSKRPDGTMVRRTWPD